MALRLPIGSSDFKQLRREGLHFVDKSLFIRDVLQAPERVLLFPRPRRFGKTLNLTMLAAWLTRSDDDCSDVFADLAVWQQGPEVRQHFQRYPVIYLTFKDVKTRNWQDCRARVASALARCAELHSELVDPVVTTPNERAVWLRILTAVPSNEDLADTLRLLSALLHRATGVPCIILIDEYDTPLHAAWQHGYWDDAVELFRNLLSGGFKDNPHLFKGVLTGILRIGKESIFSGLNNLAVHSLLSRQFSPHFGFLQSEVEALALGMGAADAMPGIEAWYNGYRFGGHTIYNPWSVINYLNNRDDGFKPYWVNTASNDLLVELLVERSTLQQQELETLLAGGSVAQVIEENTVLRSLAGHATALWSFLLFSGYLRADSQIGTDEKARPICQLTIPNREVRSAFADIFGRVLDRALGDDSQVRRLGRALLAGDVETVERNLGTILQQTLSHHDLGGDQPEKVYQAFVLGLLIWLNASHEITSNRESGYGRCDVLVCPRLAGQPGVVMELKVVDKRKRESVKGALAKALAQLRDRDYAASLRARGAEPVREMAAVFDGKRVWVQVAPEPGGQAGSPTHPR